MSHLPGLSRGAVVEQLAARLARLDLPARVAIDGADAAGKTTLADELATLLGATVTRIGADAFLRPPEERYRRGRESPEGYYEDAVDHEALRARLAEAVGLLIVDGVFLFRPELDDLWVVSRLRRDQRGRVPPTGRPERRRAPPVARSRRASLPRPVPPCAEDVPGARSAA